MFSCGDVWLFVLVVRLGPGQNINFKWTYYQSVGADGLSGFAFSFVFLSTHVFVPQHNVTRQAALCPPTFLTAIPHASYLSFSSPPSFGSSFTPPPTCHLPPFMLQQTGAAGCHDVKLVASRLAGMASFLWWHNVVAMSYTFKQWFDVTAVSVSLSNAGGGWRSPAGSTLSNKLMSTTQPPHHHKNSHPAWQSLNALIYNNTTVGFFGHNAPKGNLFNVKIQFIKQA